MKIVLLMALTLMFVGCNTNSSDAKNKLNDDNFIQDWTLLDAVYYGDKPDAMREAFDNEALIITALWQSIESGKVHIGERDLAWNRISSKTPNIDLSEHIGKKEHVYTYATTQIQAESSKSAYFGVGSDDAVKIWLNGELVHENFTSRSASIDQDLVAVRLVKGENHLVVKIVNGSLDWGFSVHNISKSEANSMFVDRAAKVSINELDRLLNQGFDINAKDASGLTALHNAQLNRLNIRAQQLIERGADKNIQMPSVETLVSSFFDNAIDQDSPGIAFLAAKNGKIIYTGAKGMADMGNNIPISASTKFRIGSITKQFTAVAILKLQEQGKLSIDDKLSKYLPDFPKADQVTLRQLMNHTSGIHNYTDAADFIEGVTTPITAQNLINKIKTFDYDFESGSRWSYSNSGYFILGNIVEQVSGKTLSQFWQEQLFTPLNMKDTGVYINGKTYSNEALGYSYEKNETLRATDWDMTHAGGAGNIYSTVEDLFRWNEALFNNKVLSPESFADFTTKAKLNNGEDVGSLGDSYGLGIGLSEIFGKKLINHNGSLNGFSSYMGRVPSENLTVVSLSNFAPANFNFEKNPFNYLASIFIEREPLAQLVDTEKSIKDMPLTDYIGEFDYNPAINNITNSGGSLFTQLPGQAKFELFRSSGDSFYLKVVAAELTFERNDSGEVVSVIHTQNGRTFTASKIEPAMFISVDEKQLARLIGNYKLNENMTLTITQEAAQLFVQATGQTKFEMLAISPLEFRAKALNLKLVFNPSSADKKAIDSLVLHQAGMAMQAEKLN
ncbi:serine hydrolase [Paraglaciecola sp.]|uniref:serine hydrolase n=1 Tax=Paraglaciecola sp. TaxID=1920173 RepID=UPI0030F42D62